MYNGKVVSYLTVLDRVHSMLKMDFDLNHSDALEWIGGLMRLLNTPKALINKIEKIPIKEGRGTLPCDLESIIQTARVGAESISQLGNVPSVFFAENEVVEEGEEYGWDYNERFLIEYSNTGSINLYPMRYSSDTMHMKYHCCDIDFSVECEDTYKIQNNHIYTNFEDGCVLMSYLAVPTDANGYPMIPDHESWIRACAYEVAYHICIGLESINKISPQFMARIERDRDWYVAQANNVFKIPSLDEMEAWSNDLTRTVPKRGHHESFFRNFQSPERVYTHRM